MDYGSLWTVISHPQMYMFILCLYNFYIYRYISIIDIHVYIYIHSYIYIMYIYIYTHMFPYIYIYIHNLHRFNIVSSSCYAARLSVLGSLRCAKTLAASPCPSCLRTGIRGWIKVDPHVYRYTCLIIYIYTYT